jgi:hypothetical protein
VRKTRHARVLRVAHARRVDLGIQRPVPVRALAHLGRTRLEVGGEPVVERRAACGEERHERA